MALINWKTIMHEDRDMTYGELVGLFGRLVELGALREYDVVMRFVQMQGADFACPFLYTMGRERVSGMIKQAAPNVPDEDVARFVEKNSVKSVSDQFGQKPADEAIGLLDFKDASKPEGEKFGGYLTEAGVLHHKLQQQGLAGMIDGPEETSAAVFGFKVFNGKWIPVLAKLPSDSDGVRTIKIPSEVKNKLEEYTRKLDVGRVMVTSLSSTDPDVLEFLEIARNPRLYEKSENAA